jgi:hypothetical protein
MKQFLVFGQTRGAKGSFRAGQGSRMGLFRACSMGCATDCNLRAIKDEEGHRASERAKVELSVHRRLSELTGRLNSRSKGHYYNCIAFQKEGRKEGRDGRRINGINK